MTPWQRAVLRMLWSGWTVTVISWWALVIDGDSRALAFAPALSLWWAVGTALVVGDAWQSRRGRGGT